MQVHTHRASTEAGDLNPSTDTMAIGACSSTSAKKLFTVAIGLYCLGLIFMVGYWNDSTETIRDKHGKYYAISTYLGPFPL